MRLALHQHPSVATDAIGGVDGPCHDLRTQWTAGKGKRGQYNHVRCALVEDEVEELVDRVAVLRVVLAALGLREARCGTGEVMAVVEKVSLYVEDELVTTEAVGGGIRVLLRVGIDHERAAWTALLVFGARPEDRQHRGRTHRRQQELTARHSDGTGMALCELSGAADDLMREGRGRLRDVLAVRAWAQLDRQTRVVVGRHVIDCSTAATAVRAVRSALSIPALRPGGY